VGKSGEILRGGWDDDRRRVASGWAMKYSASDLCVDFHTWG